MVLIPSAEQQRRSVHTQLGSLLVGTLYLLSFPPLFLATPSRKRSLRNSVVWPKSLESGPELLGPSLHFLSLGPISPSLK